MKASQFWLLHYTSLCTKEASVFYRSKLGSAWIIRKVWGMVHIYIWIAYIPNFRSIRAKDPASQWRWTFGSFYIVKSWFLVIFRCSFRALSEGLQRSPACQIDHWPVNKMFPLHFWDTGYFMKSENFKEIAILRYLEWFLEKIAEIFQF